MAVIEFIDYSMGFQAQDGSVHNLIDRLSMKVEEGRALGIVGESGCGKSMASLSVMRLLPHGAVVQGGQILFEGRDLLQLSEAKIGGIRGNKITMIFQEPMTALNPVLRVGFQIGEALRLHHPDMRRDEVERAVIEALDQVGIPQPRARIHQYPHEFSGGMRQRVMIAMAMINRPALLIADEPTTALDVTIQAQILDIMKQFKQSGGMVVVTHNLGVVAELCEEVVVMYAGCAVERGTVHAIFRHPRHPYTVGLMAAIPTLSSPKTPLKTIAGAVPAIMDFGVGCRFAQRCEHCQSICRTQRPPETWLDEAHVVQCWQACGAAKGDA
ncbi:MAG: ABC transporter ATP-binding protein [Oscillospiraceae bacterium]|jgi:oligopeptide/dipeptide ABC transporter ATP-binding protein|nr:ABC transporter ATP-binding protein [Oscillospiraceae bacterium]